MKIWGAKHGFLPLSIRSGISLALLVGALAGLPVAPVRAAATTWTVTKAADTNDGVCDSDCSLREAIAAAASGDTITFATSLSGGTITLASTLELNRNVTIDGSALASQVTIDGNTAVVVFTVDSGVTAALNSLKITQGDGSNYGGGINNSGALTVTNGTFANNNALGGGAIFNNAGAALTVTSSTFTSNQIASWGGGGTYAFGAGILNLGTLTVTGSTFTGNQASGTAGAGATANGPTGTATITGSSFDSNTGYGGGALVNVGGKMTVENSTFTSNSAVAVWGGGGAIWNSSGSLLVTDSAFTGNTTSSGPGGAIASGGPTGSTGTSTVTGNTFINNSASGDGGALAASYAAPLPIIAADNTFQGNSATGSGGAVYASANAASLAIALTNNTISNNAASSGGNLYLEQVNQVSGGSLTANLYNNILVKGATGGNCVFYGDVSNPIPTAGNDLADDSTCGTGFTNSASILLGALGNYGGGTQTFPLLPGSAAINGTSSNCPSTDQRGVTRGSTCDIGAFESQGFTLSKTGGDSQSAVINTAFTDPLSVNVTSNATPADPVDGGVLTFSAPSSGASASISGSLATIGSDGTVSVSAIANGTVGGPYNVTASASGAPSVDFALTNLTSATDTPTYTPSNTPTDTPTNTPTFTPSNTPTDTPTNTPTVTPSNTPTDTPTNTPTFTPSDTPTDTPTDTLTYTPTFTPSSTPTSTGTPTSTLSSTPTSTGTPTSTPSVTLSVVSILRHDPATNPANADNVTFRVTFNEDVQHVTLDSFRLIKSRTVTGTLNTVTAVSASVYDVNVSTVAGNGTLALGFAPTNIISDLSGNLLGAHPSIGTDEFYVIDQTTIVVIANGVIGNPGVTTIQDNGSYTSHFTSLEVLFSMDAYNPPDNTDLKAITNPDNYLLLQAGPNKIYDTNTCADFAAAGQPLGDDVDGKARVYMPHQDFAATGQPLGDDVQIPTGPVTYDNHRGAGPFVATVTLNNGAPLPDGQYRLFVCGTTSITDLAGSPLNGGTDMALNFRIADSAPASAPAPAVMPSTGFAPNRATPLPAQTVSYADLGDLWLEVPRLGAQMPIVGVPQAADGSWDVTWLGKDAGWLNGSAYPTWNGNSVLTGHVYDAFGQPGPFIALNTLWWNDQVIVHAGGAQYVYAVRSVQQVLPDDTAAMLKHEDLPWLTLVTCRGYDEASNSYQYRVLVRAVLVEVK